MKWIVSLLFLLVFASSTYSQSSKSSTVIQEISIDSLHLFIRQLSGDTSTVIGGAAYTILSRHKNQAGNDKAAQYIFEKFSSYGLITELDSFSITGKNVVGTKLGVRFPNKYFIVCGHFDTMPSGPTSPGADDNASGTAAVIEIARVLSKFSHDYTIKFIAFDEEEQDLIGSHHFAARALSRSDTILGVINLDMIGFDGNNDGKIDIHSKAVANTVQIANEIFANVAEHSLQLIPRIVPSLPYSDHESFLRRNFGAVLIIEDAGDFNPRYHTVNDRFQFLNIPYAHRITQLTAATAQEFIRLNPATSIAKNDNQVDPMKFNLFQNYPNPFNPSTHISYRLNEAGIVQLKIYDVMGREVATLINESKSAGTHSVTFDTNSIDGGLNSGIYIYSLKINSPIGSFVQNRKMTLLK